MHQVVIRVMSCLCPSFSYALAAEACEQLKSFNIRSFHVLPKVQVDVAVLSLGTHASSNLIFQKPCLLKYFRMSNPRFNQVTYIIDLLSDHKNRLPR